MRRPAIRQGVELFSGLTVSLMLVSALRAVVLAGGVGPRSEKTHLVR